MLKFHLIYIEKVEEILIMNDRLKPILSSLTGLALSLIIVLGALRLTINSFSVYFNYSVKIDLNNFKCTDLVVAKVNIVM